jgi:hypothetical protein
VKSASVTVDSELISSIGKGLLVFAGVGLDDTEKEAENMVNKVLKAKFWPDENGAQVWTWWRFAYNLRAFGADSWLVEEERTRYRGRSALWYVYDIEKILLVRY